MAAPTQVGHARSNFGGSPSSVTIPFTPVAGRKLVLGVMNSAANAGPVTALDDNQSNAYSSVYAPTVSGTFGPVRWWIIDSVLSGTMPASINATWDATAGNGRTDIFFYEVDEDVDFVRGAVYSLTSTQLSHTVDISADSADQVLLGTAASNSGAINMTTLTPVGGITGVDHSALTNRRGFYRSAPAVGTNTVGFEQGSNWAAELTSIIVGVTSSAPVLSLPTSASITQTTATAGFTTDTATGTGYVVVTTSATPPSATQIKAGQNNASEAAVFDATDASLEVGTNTFAVTGLTALTQYYYYIIQNDTDDSNIVSGDFTTLDVARPTLTSPTQINIGTTTATPRVTTDTDNGTAYYVITPSAEGSPTREQIEAGENAAGGAPTAAGSQSVSAAGVVTFTEAAGLTPNVEYRIGYTHRGTPP